MALTPEQIERGWKKSLEVRAMRKQLGLAIAKPASSEVNGVDKYVAKRVLRVRKQIDSLSDMLDREEQPQALDRIAAAIERLSKIEQDLSGRPRAGVRKPAQDRPARRQFAPGPQPVVVQSPVQSAQEPGCKPEDTQAPGC